MSLCSFILSVTNATTLASQSTCWMEIGAAERRFLDKTWYHVPLRKMVEPVWSGYGHCGTITARMILVGPPGLRLLRRWRSVRKIGCSTTDGLSQPTRQQSARSARCVSLLGVDNRFLSLSLPLLTRSFGTSGGDSNLSSFFIRGCKFFPVLGVVRGTRQDLGTGPDKMRSPAI